MRTIDGGTWNEQTGKVVYPGKPIKSTAQKKMGDVSNLITDMTIGGANRDEIACAVRHSMVVIDAEKRCRNLKYSLYVMAVLQLKAICQGDFRKVASTCCRRHLTWCGAYFYKDALFLNQSVIRYWAVPLSVLGWKRISIKTTKMAETDDVSPYLQGLRSKVCMPPMPTN